VQIGKHKIDPPFLLAPMAGVSEMPYRVIALEFGAGLATTELISAKGIFYKNRRTRQYLTYDAAKEKPYSVQLFGGEEESMCVAAVAAVEHGADIIDVNMGCPVKKVTRTGSGSALLCDPQRAAALVSSMIKAVQDQVPITVKIRTGWDANQINCVDMAKAMEDAGCAAVAVHGRTRAQAYTGVANWQLIREMKEAVQIPIIGNGDVLTADDAYRMQRETNCDAVMIGRGALGNPWIFKKLREGDAYPGPTPKDRCTLMLRHLKEHIAFHCRLDDDIESRRKHRLPPEMMAVRTFRQHLVWYSRGLPGGSIFRKNVVLLEQPEEVQDAIIQFTGRIERADRVAPREEVEGVNYKQAFG
jgi:tRNA-dihydrouridine synthase B